MLPLWKYGPISFAKETISSLLSSPYLLSYCIPLTLIWSSLRCHNFVLSSSETIDTPTNTGTNNPYNIYKQFSLTPLITISIPFIIFKPLFSNWKKYPKLSSMPKEIRFLFSLGACRTEYRALMVSLNILIFTDPMPIIFHILLLPINTLPLSTTSYL